MSEETMIFTENKYKAFMEFMKYLDNMDFSTPTTEEEDRALHDKIIATLYTLVSTLKDVADKKDGHVPVKPYEDAVKLIRIVAQNLDMDTPEDNEALEENYKRTLATLEG